MSRLDGYTVEDALQLIDRAARPARDGEFVLDHGPMLLESASATRGWPLRQKPLKQRF